MIKFSDKTVANVRRAKQALKQKLDSMEGVTGIGIGYRQRNGELVNRCVIRVYVRRKFARVLLPESQLLPNIFDGVPVDVIEEEAFPQSNGTPSVRHNPLRGGIKIANLYNYPEIGTLGYRLRDSISGAHYLLSNWHVLYGRHDSSDGEPIVQPRPYGDSNIIGHTVVGVIDSRVDCALAVIDGPRELNDRVLGLTGSVTGFGQPYLGLRVVSSGVTGLRKQGVIDDIELDNFIPFPGATRPFVNQLHIYPQPGSPTTGKGDSGSVWISEDANELIGLHFAGCSDVSIANPIQAVVEAFEEENIWVKF